MNTILLPYCHFVIYKTIYKNANAKHAVKDIDGINIVQ